jgi:GntR family transcriptional regulator, transcriptional repressor for pyruvate dehydrogenase complex
VSLAAERITPEEIADLEALLELSKQNVANHEVFLKNDIELHELIAMAAKNPILHRLLVSLNRLGEASRQKTVDIPGVADQTVKDHIAIVDALRTKDPQAAELAMLVHLANVEKRLVLTISDKKQEIDQPLTLKKGLPLFS